MTAPGSVPTAAVIARRVAAGEATARRSVEEALERASADRLNAFLSLRWEKALEEAALVDRRVAAGERLSTVAASRPATRSVTTRSVSVGRRVSTARMQRCPAQLNAGPSA